MHVSENRYQEYLHAYFQGLYSEKRVQKEPELPETGRVPDFTIDSQFGKFMVEVENDWEACIKGVGQALLYAAHDASKNRIPVIVVPEGHVEHPEVDFLRYFIPIVEIPYFPDMVEQ